MTQDEIIDMARQAGAAPDGRLWLMYAEELEAFAKLVATKAIAELESQEPVAWIHNFIDGGISIGKRPSDLDRHPDRWTALHKDPKPCPTCEALARTVMLDQTSHDTAPPQQELVCVCGAVWEGQELVETPPQRTWVGLTVEERSQLVTLHHGWNEYGQAIEAKLKEKNT